MKKTFIIIFIVIAVVLAGGLVFIRSFSHKPITDYNGTVNLKGLNDEVQVYRDKDGIPHIIAKNEHDLYLAFGYVISQDRLWQMDLIRRATQGRLSEIFGKDFVKTDLMLRSLLISDKSDTIYSHLSGQIKENLDAFADGVNQFIEQNKNRLPIEFKILGYEPEPWKPQNSINLVGYIAWDLVMAWNNEITLYQIQNKVDSAEFGLFIPDFSTDSTIYDLTFNDNDTLSYALPDAANKWFHLGLIPFNGSNNWVVNGKKTKSGKPVLCNDMHLGYGIPGIWYQAVMEIPGKLHVSGVVLPGEPFVVAGHNDSIAWGMTNVMLDGTDFYIETLNSDSTKYLLDGKWHDLKVVYEKIATKEGDTVTLPLRFTHRGPIISQFKGLNKAVSMRWIGYEYSNEVGGVYMLNKASNWHDFRRACANFGAVSQNIVYADTKGNIGLQFTGLVAKRKIPGYYMLPGDTSLYDWNGFVPFDSLPYVFNPDCNYIVSANNKTSTKFKYYVSQYYFQDYRYNRISQLLDINDTIDNNYMAIIQSDQLSLMALKFLPEMLFRLGKLTFKDGNSAKIMNYMRQWNGDMSANSVAAMFFEQFNLLFIKNAIIDELGDELTQKVMKSKILANNVLTVLWTKPDNPLFDNVLTKDKKETIDDIVKLTYLQTMDSLRSKLGNNVDDWQYGRLHNLTLEHPLAKVAVLDKIFHLNRGPYAVGGSNHTVSPYSYSYETPFAVVHGASERHIFDLDNWDNSWVIIPTGESGIPASKFYCNQTERFVNDEYHAEYFSQEQVTKNAVFTMTFKP